MNKTTKRILVTFSTIGAFLGAAVIATSLISCNQHEQITYTLDPDIEVKDINSDIQIVNDGKYPGVTVMHEDSSKADFKVQAFTDLHLDHNRTTCCYTFSMLARNILKVKPDLIIFGGDIITSSYNEARTKQFAELLEKLGVYWTAVLGNHEHSPDNPDSITRDRLLHIWAGYPHCLIDDSTKKLASGETVWGYGNHVVNLASNQGITQSIFVLDSGTDMIEEGVEQFKEGVQWYRDKGVGEAKPNQSTFYDYIKDSQVCWYNETFNEIKRIVRQDGKALPHSTILTHVPIVEMLEGYIKVFADKSIAQNYGTQFETKPDGSFSVTHYNVSPYTDYENPDNVNDLYDKDKGFVCGRRREDMCISPHDYYYSQFKEEGEADKEKRTPIFQALRDQGPNNALFCGHDHQNNFTLKFDGVFMGYIQPGGYSTNNLYSKRQLGTSPYTYQPASGDEKYGGHLIQGYSMLEYKGTSNSENNVLSDVKLYENWDGFDERNEELYLKAIELIRAQRGDYKGDNHALYDDGQDQPNII